MISSLEPSTAELCWRIQWTLAFPTLVSSLLLVVVAATTGEHLSPEDPDTTWQMLALGVLFGNETNENKPILTTAGTPADTCPLKTMSVAWSKSLGYGEITVETVVQLLQRIRWHARNHNCSSDDTIMTVVDLGSGSGRVLLAAAVGHAVRKAIGMEIAPSWHQAALQNYETIWQYWDMDCSNTVWEWTCGDFTLETDCWIKETDLVICHATVFEPGLMDALHALCQECRSGTYFCMVSQALQGDCFETLEQVQVSMNWGQATVHLQRRT